MGQEHQKRRSMKPWTRNLLIVLFIFILLAFIPTPYYLYQPGTVEALSKKVTVENGKKDEKGSLSLTTVLSIKATNVFVLLYGLVAPDTQVENQKNVKGDLTDKEYNELLIHMMDSSQTNAISAGLKAAGENVTVRHNGVFVQAIMPNSDAKDVLQVGDVIHTLDGKTLNKTQDFIDYINSSKKVNDTVKLGFSRDGKNYTKSVKVVKLSPNSDKVGIGIAPDDTVKLDTSRKVKMNVADIGGPSAGLMFSLEILNQILPEDLTKGYKIAGTGTIDTDGHVGQIGGIRDKIVAAHKAHVDIFFCPKDLKPGDANEKDIMDEAKKRNYHIKIVPVASTTEAENYLKKLKQKS
ncbi:SepM family pheromone-processing serine protease [Falsibacillus albus]|uniref:endopeptidase La n=1 Tax=Falsibacillus albus TaxID=2478915 RepID=A0A3L7JTD6_9BACI|nr:SepM family pheromone-processing serine protease [Falsibacillus albus]RLQ94108.1 PDZ domain-containing protein [Falsibacillus albus]